MGGVLYTSAVATGERNSDHEQRSLTKERNIFHGFDDRCPMYRMKYSMLVPNDAFQHGYGHAKKNLHQHLHFHRINQSIRCKYPCCINRSTSACLTYN